MISTEYLSTVVIYVICNYDHSGHSALVDERRQVDWPHTSYKLQCYEFLVDMFFHFLFGANKNGKFMDDDCV